MQQRSYAGIRFVFTLSLIIVLFSMLLCNSEAKENNKSTQHILILNSYHKGYNWTDEQSEAMLSGFRKQLPDAEEDVVYLDWKRYPESVTLTDWYRALRNKYKDTRVDLILTTDDAALSFAVKHRGEIFSNAPVVFSGIFDSTDRMLVKGQKGITGVYETVDLKGTIELATKVYPKSRNIYIIHDESETSLQMESDIRAILHKMKSPLKCHVLARMPFEQLKKKLAVLPGDGFALFASYGRDPNGLTLQPETFAGQMSSVSTVPLFVLYTHMMGTGAVGGSLLDGHLQGAAAVDLGLKILKGYPAEKLPRIMEKTVHTEFDYRALRRYGIKLSAVPKGSNILNKPASVVETYLPVLAVSIAIILVLVIFISILLANIRNRKAFQKELMKSHEELSASREELKLQYASLMESQKELQKSEVRYRLVTEAAEDIIWDIDPRSDSRYFPDRLLEILGYQPGTIHNMEQWLELVHPRDREWVSHSLKAYLNGKVPVYKLKYRVQKKNGEYLWLLASGKAIFDINGKAVQMAGAYTDITIEKEQESLLDHLAYYDQLTELPNRVWLRQYVSRILKPSDGKCSELCLIFIDLDNFKYVNDSFGHQEGDELLKQVAGRMKALIPANGCISRFGGDEFVILLNEGISESMAARMAEKLLESSAEPYEIRNNRFYITLSIGIVLYPRDGKTFDELLQNADTAMYSSKETGKSRFTVYSSEMNQSVVRRMRLYSQIRNALDLNEFEIFYQPQVDINTLYLRGFEALLRWNNPAEGLVPPARFIQACEETGLIVPLGYWVLETACAKAKEIMDAGNRDFIMSVNISAIQLVQTDFADSVRQIIERVGIEPSHLELEITESILIDSIEVHIDKLRQLRALGIRIALDDFGSGYSSLNYLKRLPLNVLKIDKTFIDNIHYDKKSESLVASIINIAGNMGLDVVAEGVELQEQRDLLVKYGCRWMQGYLVARPMPLAQAESFLRNPPPDSAG